MADEVHNIFGHYWHKMIFENYRKHYPAERLFNLNRAGFAGSQRYSIYPWTGDVARSWGGFKAQIPTMLHMSMSGLPFIHSDAGGFAQGTKDEELYTRWIQFSCFTPILRPHGSGIPSEPVYFSEQTQDIVREFMKLRYSLLPYIYTAAAQAHIRGYPITRPLFFDFPDDTACYALGNQYLLGPNLMVAPVIEKGSKEMEVYFPEDNWFNFWDDNIIQGGKLDTLLTPIESMPLFVRAGSFIPMVAPVNSTDQYSSKELTIRYYPSSKGDSAFYNMFEDDGKTFGTIGRGEFELLRFKAEHPNEKSILITMIKDGWDYSGMPRKRILLLEIAGTNEKNKYEVFIDGKKVKSKRKDEESALTYFSDTGRLTIEIPWRGEYTTIGIKQK
jgi:alpha-glucosidase (family GH31 glycosyl hydrolase)